jgi:hypothetical protein
VKYWDCPLSSLPRLKSTAEPDYTGTGRFSLYLSITGSGSACSYHIRKSVKTGDKALDYRTIFNLGPNPRDYFSTVDDHIVLFDDNLLQAVSAQVTGDPDLALEKLLWSFLPPETRRRHRHYMGRSAVRPARLTTAEKESISWQIHNFDRRRLYYLRYGAVDQSRLSKLHEKCCRPLIGMCRDEKENYFINEETALKPGMYLQYIHAIFNLQKHCSESFASWFPEALEKNRLGEVFLAELCSLNEEPSFWLGETGGPVLSPHLRRYLIMFFDYSPTPRSFAADYARHFMAGRRRFSWAEHTSYADPAEIGDMFGTSYDDLRKMDRKQLGRLFRKKAMELHPDQGGDHDQFIRLKNIYNALLKKKSGSP